MSTCGKYNVGNPPSCNGENTETVMADFQILYIWLILSVVFYIGLMLSMIRDVVPKHYRGDIEPRYHSGESIRVGRYFLEEYLLTGWFFKKPDARFSNAARWCLLFSNLFVEMLSLGVFYYIFYVKGTVYDYSSTDYGYAFISAGFGFANYLVAYVMLVNLKGEAPGNVWPRHALGYIYVLISYTLSTSFIFWVTYQFYGDSDFTDVQNLWMLGFGVTSGIELLISENIRIGSRALMIWAQKDEEIRIDTAIEMQGYNAPRMKTGKTFSFSQA